MRSLLLLCVLLICAVEFTSALSWAQINTTQYYGERVRHRIAYNKGTQTLILTGGFSYPGTSAIVNSQDQSTIVDALAKQRIPANDVWISRDSGYTWTKTTSSPAYGVRSGHTSIVSYSDTFVIGGQTNINANVTRDGYKYQPTNDVYKSSDYVTWTPVVATTPRFTPRYGHASAFDEDNSVMYVLGGQTSNLTYLNDVWMSSDRGASWFLRTANAGWDKRSGHSSGFIANTLYVVGGADDKQAYNDLWRSYDGGSTWVQSKPTPPWSQRTLHTSIVYGPQILIIAGCGKSLTNGFTNEIWISPDAGTTWTRDVTPPFSPRAGAAGAIIGNQALLVGGFYVNSSSIPYSYRDTWTTTLPRNPTNADGAIVAAIFGIIVLFVGLTYWVWINAKRNGLFGMSVNKEKWVKDETEMVHEEEIPEPTADDGDGAVEDEEEAR